MKSSALAFSAHLDEHNAFYNSNSALLQSGFSRQ
jgi:hypothetical protein